MARNPGGLSRGLSVTDFVAAFLEAVGYEQEITAAASCRRLHRCSQCLERKPIAQVSATAYKILAHLCCQFRDQQCRSASSLLEALMTWDDSSSGFKLRMLPISGLNCTANAVRMSGHISKRHQLPARQAKTAVTKCGFVSSCPISAR